MALGIGRHGIVLRRDDGWTAIVRPGRNGGPGTEIEVPESLAETYRLATGDIVEGPVEPIADDWGVPDEPGDPELEPGWDTQIDEPSAVRTGRTASPLRPHRRRAERLVRVDRINGLELAEAEERPFPRSKRSAAERVPPDRWLAVSRGPADATGRTLDFSAPLGMGLFGVVYGSHGAGLTRTLQAVLNGVLKHAPDAVPIVLLLRPRAEEATEWRDRAPEADIIVAATPFTDTTPEQTLELCTLVLEAAQRQTEMGRDVILLVDSLTALWAAMLESEQADAQHEADTSAARQKVREWTQKAGCFHGEGLLGSGLGGTLTILGSVWNQATDIEAEEERDTHPHLRLLEHVLPECGWLVALSESLKRRRLFPAIDVRECRSQYEQHLLPQEILEEMLRVRGGLPRRDPVKVHLRLMDALDCSTDLQGLLVAIEEIGVRADQEELAKREREAAEVKPAPGPRQWDLLRFPDEESSGR